MPVIAVGLSHKTAPVAIRDRFAFKETEWPPALRDLVDHGKIEEGYVLSTCNRSEIYALVEEEAQGYAVICDFLSHQRSVSLEEMDPYLYRLGNGKAVEHLFRVAAGLDSMVVGEPQILGQVRDAFEIARSEHLTGPVLNKLLQTAVEVGKRARTETGISEGAVSVSFAAVELAKKIFGGLEGRSAMLIGAGETGELTAQHLVDNGIHRLWVANRTHERAVQLAERFGGSAVLFEQLFSHMVEVDVVISSTAASGYVIHRDPLDQVMWARKNRPVFLIDIAVPRDIDPTVKDLYNVFLYDIDDLQAVVAANIQQREREARRAEQIVAAAVAFFDVWYRSLDVMPTLIALRKRFDELREAEFGRVVNKFEGMTERDRRLVEGMMKRYANKLLHGFMSHVKNCAGSGDGAVCLTAIQCLFGLVEEAEAKRLCREVHNRESR